MDHPVSAVASAVPALKQIKYFAMEAYGGVDVVYKVCPKSH
jgi:hypothetical protein